MHGRTLGVVGESGCGKSTLARLVAGLLEPTAGTIEIDGHDRAAIGRREIARRVQLVFQDPLGALNPRKRIGEMLDTPLRRLRGFGPEERRERARAALQRVGLEDSHLERYPHGLSGGEAQRVGIARALVVEPRVLVLDEAVSSLDVSIQGDVLRLLRDIQLQSGIAYVFISHDLSVVEALADVVAVMYLGRIVEIGEASAVFGTPKHPYTRALLSAVPVLGERRERIPIYGEPGDAADPPSGCVYHPRCYRAEAVCSRTPPPLEPSAESLRTACLFSDDTDPAKVGAAPSDGSARP